MTQRKEEEQGNDVTLAGDKERFVSLKNDYAFTQIMRNKTVLKGFLEAVLKISADEITDIKILDRHLERLSKEDKLGILDVRVSIRDKEDIDIELQIRCFKYWMHRTIFYISKMYTEHIKKGQWYENCRKVIHISILDFDLFPENQYFYTSYHLREDCTNKLYSDLLELHVVELKKLKTSLLRKEHHLLEKWCQLISAESEEERAMIETDPYIKVAIDEIERIKADEEKYYEYELRERALRDYMSQMESEREEGREQGREEGREQGREEGREQGREQGALLAVKVVRMHDDGRTVADIANNLEINSEKVERIIKEWKCK